MKKSDNVPCTKKGVRAHRKSVMGAFGDQNTHKGVYARGTGEIINMSDVRKFVENEAKRGTPGANLAGGVAMLVGEVMEYIALRTDNPVLMISIMLNTLISQLSKYNVLAIDRVPMHTITKQ